jgi:hypothetical protein
MDPDENLKEQRRLKARIKAGLADKDDRARLRELQAAYREWTARGGFLGKSPKKPRKIRLKAGVAKKLLERAGVRRRGPVGVKVTRPKKASSRKKAAVEVDPADRFTLTREPLDSGGYARSSGKYFGVGAPVYSYENEDGSKSGFIRSYDRTAAKNKIRRDTGRPKARFGR